MFTKLFWMGASERAVKTFAQSLLGSLIVTIPVLGQAWPADLGVAATAAVISLLTSLTSPAFVAGSTPTPPVSEQSSAS